MRLWGAGNNILGSKPLTLLADSGRFWPNAIEAIRGQAADIRSDYSAAFPADFLAKMSPKDMDYVLVLAWLFDYPFRKTKV
jgi:hypothetical protein